MFGRKHYQCPNHPVPGGRPPSSPYLCFCIMEGPEGREAVDAWDCTCRGTGCMRLPRNPTLLLSDVRPPIVRVGPHAGGPPFQGPPLQSPSFQGPSFQGPPLPPPPQRGSILPYPQENTPPSRGEDSFLSGADPQFGRQTHNKGNPHSSGITLPRITLPRGLNIPLNSQNAQWSSVFQSCFRMTELGIPDDQKKRYRC